MKITVALITLLGFLFIKEPQVEAKTVEPAISGMNAEDLKLNAFEVLKTKCNICHKKQNPFMVFNEKNMTRRARKIYQMVFVKRKMPKGDEISLTDREYTTLENWLLTQDIF